MLVVFEGLWHAAWTFLSYHAFLAETRRLHSIARQHQPQQQQQQQQQSETFYLLSKVCTVIAVIDFVVGGLVLETGTSAIATLFRGIVCGFYFAELNRHHMVTTTGTSPSSSLERYHRSMAMRALRVLAQSIACVWTRLWIFLTSREMHVHAQNGIADVWMRIQSAPTPHDAQRVAFTALFAATLPLQQATLALSHTLDRELSHWMHHACTLLLFGLRTPPTGVLALFAYVQAPMWIVGQWWPELRAALQQHPGAIHVLPHTLRRRHAIVWWIFAARTLGMVVGLPYVLGMELTSLAPWIGRIPVIGWAATLVWWPIALACWAFLVSVNAVIVQHVFSVLHGGSGYHPTTATVAEKGIGRSRIPTPHLNQFH